MLGPAEQVDRMSAEQTYYLIQSLWFLNMLLKLIEELGLDRASYPITTHLLGPAKAVEALDPHREAIEIPWEKVNHPKNMSWKNIISSINHIANRDQPFLHPMSISYNENEKTLVCYLARPKLNNKCLARASLVTLLLLESQLRKLAVLRSRDIQDSALMHRLHYLCKVGPRMQRKWKVKERVIFTRMMNPSSEDPTNKHTKHIIMAFQARQYVRGHEKIFKGPVQDQHSYFDRSTLTSTIIGGTNDEPDVILLDDEATSDEQTAPSPKEGDEDTATEDDLGKPHLDRQFEDLKKQQILLQQTLGTHGQILANIYEKLSHLDTRGKGLQDTILNVEKSVTNLTDLSTKQFKQYTSMFDAVTGRQTTGSPDALGEEGLFIS